MFSSFPFPPPSDLTFLSLSYYHMTNNTRVSLIRFQGRAQVSPPGTEFFKAKQVKIPESIVRPRVWPAPANLLEPGTQTLESQARVEGQACRDHLSDHDERPVSCFSIA